ncbi:LOW QUALITY PROTEIN: hypothetical protein Bca4012_032320 [Brassica carinata]
MRNTFIKGRNRESKIEKESQLENTGTLIERNRENPRGEPAKTVKRFTTSRRQKPAKTGKKIDEAQSFHLRQDTGGGEHSGVPATSPKPACPRLIVDLSNSWSSYNNPPSESCGPDARFRLSNLNSFFSSVELQSEILDLCAQNPKSIGQEGTALTRCTARRTAISSESSVADSHHHNRCAHLCAPITDLQSRTNLCTVL